MEILQDIITGCAIFCGLFLTGVAMGLGAFAGIKWGAMAFGPLRRGIIVTVESDKR